MLFFRLTGSPHWWLSPECLHENRESPRNRLRFAPFWHTRIVPSNDVSPSCHVLTNLDKWDTTTNVLSIGWDILCGKHVRTRFWTYFVESVEYIWDNCRRNNPQRLVCSSFRGCFVCVFLLKVTWRRIFYKTWLRTLRTWLRTWLRTLRTRPFPFINLPIPHKPKNNPMSSSPHDDDYEYPSVPSTPTRWVYSNPSPPMSPTSPDYTPLWTPSPVRSSPPTSPNYSTPSPVVANQYTPWRAPSPPPRKTNHVPYQGRIFV